MSKAERTLLGDPATEVELEFLLEKVRQKYRRAFEQCPFKDAANVFKDLAVFFQNSGAQRTGKLPPHAWLIEDLQRGIPPEFNDASRQKDLSESITAATAVMKFLAKMKVKGKGTFALPAEDLEQIRNTIFDLGALSKLAQIMGTFSGKREIDASDLSPLLIELDESFTDLKGLIAILEMLGKLKDSESDRQRQSIKPPSGELYDLCFGSDLESIVPSELALYANPLTKLEFLRRFTERSLLQYSPRPRELRRGPICLAIDRSPSMIGLKSTFARGIALFCLQKALAQKRDCCVVFFDTTATVYEFPWRDTRIDQIVKVLGEGFRDGTLYRSGLTACRKQIKKSRYKDAEILLIGDSEEKVDNQRAWYQGFETFLKRTRTRLFTIQLGTSEMSLLKLLRRLSTDMLVYPEEGIPDLKQTSAFIESAMNAQAVPGFYAGFAAG